MRTIERYPLPEEPTFNPEAEEAALDKLAHELAASLSDYVDSTVQQRDYSPKTLTVIENNLYAQTSYIRHTAIILFLEQRGLLAPFYYNESAYSDLNNGWKIELERPVEGRRARKLYEHYAFTSRDLADDPHGTTHRFMLTFQLRKR